MRALSLTLPSTSPSLPLALALALALAPLGCAGDDGGSASASASASSTSGASMTATTTGDLTTSGDPTGASESASSGSTTGDPTTGGTTSSSTSTSSASSSTTGAELCHFGGTGESGGSAEPWLELTHKGAAIADGSVLGLECGLQGLFMLELIPYFGGFDPDDAIISMAVVMDVEGFNLNPEGHFYSFADFGFYAGCDIGDGGQGYIIPIIPPDTIADLADLDGAIGDLTVTLFPDGGGAPVVVSASVTLGALVDPMWEFCGYMP